MWIWAALFIFTPPLWVFLMVVRFFPEILTVIAAIFVIFVAVVIGYWIVAAVIISRQSDEIIWVEDFSKLPPPALKLIYDKLETK